MRSGNPGRGQRLPQVRNSRERLANWAGLCSAQRPTPGGYSRDPGTFQASATAGIRGILAASRRVFNRYNPHRRRFCSGRILFSFYFREVAPPQPYFTIGHAATSASCDCHPSCAWLPLLHHV